MTKSPPTFRINELTTSDSSCTYTHGKTTIVAGICKPREAKMAQDSSEAMVFDVTVRKNVGLPGNFERCLESTIVTVLRGIIRADLFPHSVLGVTVDVLSDDGGVIASSINAVALAVVNLGIPLTTVALASAVSLIGEEWVTDCDLAAESSSSCRLTNAVCLRSGKLISTNLFGTVDLPQVAVAKRICADRCRSLEYLFAKSVAPQK